MNDACLAPILNPKKPDVVTPRPACDSHFHIFGPTSRFPFSPERAYTPAEAPLERLLALHALLGFERGVAIQGNGHGTDNSAMLDALQREPKRLRGVAIVKESTTREEVRRMADAGVRALRFHIAPRQPGRFSSLGIDAFEKLAPFMDECDMHVQFFMDARELPNVLARLKNWKRPVVLDHFGSTKAAEGTAAPGFETLRKFLGEGRIWVKLSGAYRASEQYPDYPDAKPLHEALLKANPDQLLWGSDWPHPNHDHVPDDGLLVDALAGMLPDAQLREQVLVLNPGGFYGFGGLRQSPVL